MHKLPIDDVLPQLLSALNDHDAVVLHAPPGAGKTTRVPLALLDAPWLQGKGIVMLEPRRLAATNAARWMASTIGEEVGKTVGYAIRFDRKVSSQTRVEVVTEGILTRRLHADPCLTGVGVVIFDEFHERSIHSDLALALCRDVQQGLRDDLKIVVMSATLDAVSVSQLLGDAPVVASEGRSFPVDVRYLDRDPQGDVASAAALAVGKALREMEGDVLVFLPGTGEIRRCQRLLEEDNGHQPAPLITPLYGDLPFAAQEKAILPAGRRKVVLATNIAETSLTIEGVRVVIDAGFSRRLMFDPASGLNRLVTVRVTAASAVQRAGRAGRLGPGCCYRLWTEHTQRTLLPANPPEICTSDLTPLALDLANWGVTNAGSLSWLDPPPAAALAEGRQLLAELGALDRQGKITDVGKRMAALPVHPRLGHMLLVARERGMGALGSDIAALVGERDIFRRGSFGGKHQRSDSDMTDRVEALHEWRSRRGGGVDRVTDPQACRTVDNGAAHLRRLLGIGEGTGHLPVSSEMVGLLLAWAYPDRIALRRDQDSDRYLLANGRGGTLSARSAVKGQQLIVAYQTERGERGDDMITLASALLPETLRSEFAGNIAWQRVVEWDSREGRVVAREEERFEALVLGTRPVTPTDEEIRAALLAGVAGGPGLAALCWTPQAAQFRARVLFLASLFPEEGWPDFSDGQLTATLDAWLGPYLGRVRSLAELSAVDLLAPLRALLSWEQLRRLDEGAPTHIMVPSGSRIPLDYAREGAPALSVKLQEMFGLADTPSVAWGRVPVVVHLLSPAGRPIQVTSDLRGFWNGAYQDVKKEMKGRYPKHPWPDDPWGAVPTRGTKRQQR